MALTVTHGSTGFLTVRAGAGTYRPPELVTDLGNGLMSISPALIIDLGDGLASVIGGNVTDLHNGLMALAA